MVITSNYIIVIKLINLKELLLDDTFLDFNFIILKTESKIKDL